AQAWAQNDESTERTSTPPDAATGAQERVVFADETLILAWEASNPGERVKEYIPAGEKLESWTRLASIREYDELDDVPALVGSFVRVLKERYPKSPVKVFESQASGEAMIEFLVWPGDGALEDAPFVEYNIFKYSKRAEGGCVAQQYALRAYDNFETFLTELDAQKKGLLEEMSTQGLQLQSAEEAAAGDNTEEAQDVEAQNNAESSEADGATGEEPRDEVADE
ncbi:MAG: hypothetical protein JNG90_00370, partial [Planctomycetaceae bacterium]|nr:hypothetical protein [Planctomycetaceae bacterium]